MQARSALNDYLFLVGSGLVFEIDHAARRPVAIA